MNSCCNFTIPVLLIFLSSCGGADNANPQEETETGIEFINPQLVTIHGYTGDAMEPFISPDNNILFFNNLNSSTLKNGSVNDTNLHYATRIDNISFQYMGEVIGANTDQIVTTNELEGVASLDINNIFYFVSIVDYFDENSINYLRSLYQAEYTDGILTNITSIPNLKHNRNDDPVIGELNFDAEINNDGSQLYFVEGLFSGDAIPDHADIGIASKSDDIYQVNTDSGNIMALINTDDLEYAPSISRNNLELYFTRAAISLTVDVGIFVATRDTSTAPWSKVSRLNSITGDLTEAPSISQNGELLYYHQKVSGTFQIYLVERKTD